MAGDILVYGTDWCGLTYRVREYLMNARLTYQYFDIDRDSDAQDVMLSLTDGRRSFPLVVVERRVVIDPTTAELQRVLDEHDIRPGPRAQRLERRV
jgi:mycoredoxin